MECELKFVDSVRVRIAPSPTGDPHVGTAYMALFNYAFAKRYEGKFILRIEDTDRLRSRSVYEENIYEALRWMGLNWDEGPDVGGGYGPYRQSERTSIYREFVDILLREGKAYKCFATAEELEEMREVASMRGGRKGYDRRYRYLSAEEVREREDSGQPYVVRLKAPLEGECVYYDLIRGRCEYPWADVDDQVLLKSDGFPTYHLANVVDDHLMKITHVIRGEEWISSTPKHILLYEVFGWEPPQFMHMPLLLGIDGKKLSKRVNPTSIFFYRDVGYLRDAFVNFLSLIGYSAEDGKEIYSLKEFVECFDYKRVGSSGGVFDVKKFMWINQQYIIKDIGERELWREIKAWSFSDDFMERLMPLAHTRIKTFSDFMKLFYFLFVDDVDYSRELLCPRGFSETKSAMLLQGMIWYMDGCEEWSGRGFEMASRGLVDIFGVHYKKEVIPLLFGVIMGKKNGPPLFKSIDILGKDRTRARLLGGIKFLGGLSNNVVKDLRKGWDRQDCKAAFSCF